MADESAVATTVVRNPDSSDDRSDTLPISQGEKASPKKWITNRLTAIAVARIWASTELMIAALSGAVFSRSRKPAIAIAGTITGPRVNRAMAMIGIPIPMLAADTR